MNPMMMGLMRMFGGGGPGSGMIPGLPTPPTAGAPTSTPAPGAPPVTPPAGGPAGVPPMAGGGGLPPQIQSILDLAKNMPLGGAGAGAGGMQGMMGFLPIMMSMFGGGQGGGGFLSGLMEKFGQGGGMRPAAGVPGGGAWGRIEGAPGSWGQGQWGRNVTSVPKGIQPPRAVGNALTRAQPDANHLIRQGNRQDLYQGPRHFETAPKLT